MSESPLGQEGLADHLVGRSEATEPTGSMVWTLYVSDQFVEASGDDWSGPVRFRFERLEDGRLDLWMRDERSWHVSPPPNTPQASERRTG